MTNKTHNWVRTKNRDRFNRDAFFCTDCDALCLTSESEYKFTLDQNGCSATSCDFDQLYDIKYLRAGSWFDVAAAMSISGAWEMASAFVRRTGNQKVEVFDKHNKEVDFSPYTQ